MHICRVIIKNYRNLKNVDVKLGNAMTLVGENNSGKSNFLKAISLPLSSEDGESKRLTWHDINKEERNRYYGFIKENAEQIKNGKIDEKTFNEHLPFVSVELHIHADEKEHRDINKILCDSEEGFVGGILYRYYIDKPGELLSIVQSMMNSEGAGGGEDFQKSLLPMDSFSVSITVPGKDCSVPYEIRKMFKTVDLPAERDTFSMNMDRLGSKALVDVLQKKLAPRAKVNIEKEYTKFFLTIKSEAELEKILNWQVYSEIPNADVFFDQISILPNMPQIGSILGNVRLGYDEEPLFVQGLGHRNLVLMMILLNSYLNSPHDISLRTVTVEEPEAHLSTSNILLLASFFKKFSEQTSYTQLFFSTHSTEFVNKMGLESIVFVHNGNVISIKEELDKDSLDYLAANPNTDIFKLFYSRRVILVEGITEELLIKSYLQTQPELNDIKVLSFHKGYTKIIKIWKRINEKSKNRLGIVRDYDEQPNAQREHEVLQDERVNVRTTMKKTLEPEILATGKNFELLKQHYGTKYGWSEMTEEEVSTDWAKRKTEIMLQICHDLTNGQLKDFALPTHIQQIVDFMIAGEHNAN